MKSYRILIKTETHGVVGLLRHKMLRLSYLDLFDVDSCSMSLTWYQLVSRIYLGFYNTGFGLYTLVRISYFGLDLLDFGHYGLIELEMSTLH